MSPFKIGTYEGPALALVGEKALVRIENGEIVAAKFFAKAIGLGYAWHSYPGGWFNVPTDRPPVTE